MPYPRHTAATGRQPRWVKRRRESARALALSWAFAAWPAAAFADEIAAASDSEHRAPELSAPASGDATTTPRDAQQTRLISAAILATSVGGTLAYGHNKWWKDGFTGDFKSVNEGWFGQGTTYGGADKLGHAMFAYTGSRLMTRAYELAGNDKRAALTLGLATAVGTLMAIEVLDGYSKRWRFSKEDALANLAGGVLAYAMETQPALDALIDFRLQYRPSRGPDGRRAFDPFGDYSGQRYLLVFKASGAPALKEQSWARYLELSVGYGARNFEPESRTQIAPTRRAYFGISLNLSQILRDTVYKGNVTPSRTQRVTETFFEHFQLPGTIAQRGHLIR